MATSSVTGFANGFTTRTSTGTNTFLGYSDKSPVQQMLADKATEQKRFEGYQDSEDFLRMRAFEVSNRIKLMNRMGQTDAVASLRKEAQEIIQKYMALQQKAAKDAAAKQLEDSVNAKFGLSTSA